MKLAEFSNVDFTNFKMGLFLRTNQTSPSMEKGEV